MSLALRPNPISTTMWRRLPVFGAGAVGGCAPPSFGTGRGWGYVSSKAGWAWRAGEALVIPSPRSGGMTNSHG